MVSLCNPIVMSVPPVDKTEEMVRLELEDKRIPSGTICEMQNRNIVRYAASILSSSLSLGYGRWQHQVWCIFGCY